MTQLFTEHCTKYAYIRSHLRTYVRTQESELFLPTEVLDSVAMVAHDTAAGSPRQPDNTLTRRAIPRLSLWQLVCILFPLLVVPVPLNIKCLDESMLFQILK